VTDDPQGFILKVVTPDLQDLTMLARGGEASRYRAFFVTLGASSEGSSEWRAAFAGLVTLRYLDAWADGGVSAGNLASERQAVQAAIDAVSADLPDRALLTSLVALSTREPRGALSHLAPLLMAYGRSLHQQSMWALAVAVYARVRAAYVAGSGPRGDAMLAAAAALRSGACYRKMGDARAAEADYKGALVLARKWGDDHTALRARTSLANLDADRGNLPGADQQLARVISDAVSERTREVRALAWHDRANVAHRRGMTAAAIDYAYEAWSAIDDPAARERVLADLATMALAAGYRDTARDANTVLIATAREPWVRWVATINLMEIAALDRREVDFTRLRRTLARVALPPVLEAEYLYYGALGDLAFQRRSQAIEALQRTVEIAEKRLLGEVLFRAEQALMRASDGTDEAPSAPVATPERLAHVTAALANARIMATVSE
jgi:tetratricopeptide (TPR) repeat protein